MVSVDTIFHSEAQATSKPLVKMCKEKLCPKEQVYDTLIKFVKNWKNINVRKEINVPDTKR